MFTQVPIFEGGGGGGEGGIITKTVAMFRNKTLLVVRNKNSFVYCICLLWQRKPHRLGHSTGCPTLPPPPPALPSTTPLSSTYSPLSTPFPYSPPPPPPPQPQKTNYRHSALKQCLMFMLPFQVFQSLSGPVGIFLL